jgi:LacI family transcriptional regulator
MEERFPNLKVQRFFEMPESDDETHEFLRDVVVPAVGDDGLAAVYNVGPGNFGVGRALGELKRPHAPMFVAHDLLEVHRSMLLSGMLSYVIDQDVYYSVSTASRVLRSLCDGVRGALSIGNPRVEIVTAENLA